MGRRVSLPAADEIFRRTTGEPDPARPAEQPSEPASSDGAGSRDRQPSGRVRHDEKMTVYVTADELL
ncbi:MAG: hypothetical protein ABI873_15120, partial [Marmoricola sp.]